MDASIPMTPPAQKVLNLFGGPGSGKSTMRSGLFNLLKQAGHKVEEVTEFAKDLTYGKDYGSLRDQLWVLAEQNHRQYRLRGQVDLIITDSPIPLSLAYAGPEYDGWLEEAAWGAWDLYENYSVFVRRKKPYATYGRNQTESQALALDMEVRELFKEAAGSHMEIDGDANAPYHVYAWLQRMGVFPRD